MQYAIDFGTSNTVVARINSQGELETIRLPFSQIIPGQPPLIPSQIYVQDANQAKVLIGQEVSDRGLDLKNDPRFFYGFKRAISNPAPGFLPELDGQQLSWQAIGNYFLQALISQLPDADSLVITVPVDSFESYRQWLSTIAQQESISQIRLLDEPTAAALGYGLADQDRAQDVLVIDFGGGTLDLVWVKLDQAQFQENPTKVPFNSFLKWGKRISPATQKHPIAKVLAKYGLNLGGIDIDNWLLDYFNQTLQVPKNSLTARLVERLKISLSSHTSVREVFFDDRTFSSYDLALERSQLQQILEQHNFFSDLDKALKQIELQIQQRQPDLSLDAVDTVILVGGTSQMPGIQTWIRQYFAEEKIHADKPFEAISHGALAQGWNLQDILFHSYGIRYWDKKYQRHSWHSLISAGQSYPLSQPVELILGASMPNQSSIELVIGEIGEATTEIFFDGDRLVSRRLDANLGQNPQLVQPLNDSEPSKTIAKLSPLGMPGSDRIKVSFTVDAQRLLRITVIDLLTDMTLSEDQAVVQLV